MKCLCALSNSSWDLFLIAAVGIEFVSTSNKITMYLLPLLDAIGNLPVWSVATFPVMQVDPRNAQFVRVWVTVMSTGLSCFGSEEEWEE